MATRKSAQSFLAGDPSCDMGLGGMLRRGHILELEILFRRADNLLWPRRHLSHPCGLGRREAVSNSFPVMVSALNPNQPMGLTASRRATQFSMGSTHQSAATRAIARGSSSCSR